MKYCKYVLLILITIFSTGCATFNYYGQSISGQWEVLNKRQNIEKIIANESTTFELRDRLKTVLEIREFSINRLGLPDNGSYYSYTDLQRDFVVWNIFATDEFSLEPKQWCFLFVGCLQYRGYFSEENARNYDNELKKKGMETYLGGVSAYSTLGWFDDPLLNTMLKWSDAKLAAVIFHELTHQLIYIKGDTEFNESLADAIGIIGVKLWLTSTGNITLLNQYLEYLEREDQFVSLILNHKKQLEQIYSKDLPISTKRKLKDKLFSKIRDEYNVIKKSWKRDYYGTWIKSKLNNASIASIVSYRKYLPAFLNLYEALNNDIALFLDKVKLLSHCDKQRRNVILIQQIHQFEC